MSGDIFYCGNISNMSEPSPRGRSRSPSKEAQRIPDESELKNLKVAELKNICSKFGIDITDVKLKQEIIDRMLGRTSYSGEASARSRSPRASSASKSFTGTYSAKRSPSRGASASARGGEVPHQLAISAGQSEADDFASLTAGSIAGMPAQTADKTRRDQWKSLCVTLGRQPWDDINLLKQGIDLRMVPETPIPVIDRRPMFVVTAAPPGSGKSNASAILGISKNSMIDVDPDDAFNEFFVEMFGSFPPKTDDACDEWWEKHKQEFHKYETVNLHAGRVNVRPHAPKCCIAKTYNITTQYGTILEKEEVMAHIFDKATLGGRGKLDIVFNTTGGGMSEVIDKYIAQAVGLEYDIVVVGIYSTPENCSARAAHRNTQQHRRMEPFLVSNLNTKFKHAQTIFDWEEKSRTQEYRLVLLENNWTPQNKDGAVSVVFDRNANGEVVVGPTGVLLTSGFYGMKFQNRAFVGRSEVIREAAAAKRGHGGSSRKRRISRRRIHGSRARKTIKKYSRPITRRRRHRHCSI